MDLAKGEQKLTINAISIGLNVNDLHLRMIYWYAGKEKENKSSNKMSVQDVEDER